MYCLYTSAELKNSTLLLPLKPQRALFQLQSPPSPLLDVINILNFAVIPYSFYIIYLQSKKKKKKKKKPLFFCNSGLVLSVEIPPCWSLYHASFTFHRVSVHSLFPYESQCSQCSHLCLQVHVSLVYVLHRYTYLRLALAL